MALAGGRLGRRASEACREAGHADPAGNEHEPRPLVAIAREHAMRPVDVDARARLYVPYRAGEVTALLDAQRELAGARSALEENENGWLVIVNGDLFTVIQANCPGRNEKPVCPRAQ